MQLSTRDLTGVLRTLLSELVNGSPDPIVGTSMLNRGDPGLLASLEKISAAEYKPWKDADWTTLIGSIAYLAHDLGAIRQIDRATRGPAAEDERPFQQS